MDKQRQEEIIKALESKGVFQPCPRCTNLEFEVVGESAIPIYHEPGTPGFKYPSLPVILVSCKRCGYIAQHARAVLGLPRRA